MEQARLSWNARIAVVAPDYCVSGGIFIIRDFVAALVESGANVSLLTPSGPRNADNRLYGHATRAVESVAEMQEEPFDLLVFTLWMSLFWADRISSRRYLWLAQSVEQLTPPPDEVVGRVDATMVCLLRGYSVIAVSPWVRAILETDFGIEATLIPNTLSRGTDWESAHRTRPWQKLTSPRSTSVLVEGSFEAYKNLGEAISICDGLGFSRRILVAAGSPPDEQMLPELARAGWEIHTNIERSQVLRLLSEADCIVRTSKLDSFGLAPLEMMATGGLVFVKHYQGAPGLCLHGRTAVCFSNSADIAAAFVENERSSGAFFESIAQGGRRLALEGIGRSAEAYVRCVRGLVATPWSREEVIAFQLLCHFRNIGLAVRRNAIPTFLSGFETGSGPKRPSVVSARPPAPLRYRIADFLVMGLFKRMVPAALYKKSQSLFARFSR